MKIGITTHYLRSKNYGGLLQAYALVRVLQTIDKCFPEQIKLQIGYSSKRVGQKLIKAINPIKVSHFIYGKIKTFYCKIRTRHFANLIAVRNRAISAFEDEITHSQTEVSAANIAECATNYSLFITGSDQVWDYINYNPAFFLNFPCTGKISYAASLGHGELPDKWKVKYQELLKDFFAISVREEEAVDILQPISPVPVEWVLDPTLLLSASDWDEICSPRQVKEPYLFCYFLGGSKRDRKIAENVAKKKGLKIVTLPYLHGKYRSVDKNFGDIQLWAVGPREFISLIKYAEFILTDSFHGTVFSYIYRRPFATFEREGAKGMSGRLKSLTDLTDTQDRFLTTPEMASSDHICGLSPTLPKETEKMKIMRGKSMDFLRRNIEAVRQEWEKTNAQ